MYKRIIFVCTGNTCRSPMAEEMLKKLLAEEGLDYEVISRGLNVFFPSKANEKAIEVVKSYDIDLSSHEARPISLQDIEKTALLLTMTKAHKVYLLKMFPHLSSDVHVLKEFVGDVGDVGDPFSGNLDIYESCASELMDLMERLVIKLGKEFNIEE